MVRAGTPRAAAARRFPRPRGDGPYLTARVGHSTPVPPPTRGWSLSILAGRPSMGGSPAHAGMVRSPTRGGRRAARFPRPRGDGPSTGTSRTGRKRVPPPTRGWSAFLAAWCGLLLGSPAHAGMVRALGAGMPAVCGFPRPRGDGPLDAARRPSRDRVPPPTRGWSPASDQALHTAAGSPAHAGMVPDARPEACARHRFPRPRGDGPRGLNVCRCHQQVPPPTRGWSFFVDQDRLLGRGSPAHAGMVLL